MSDPYVGEIRIFAGNYAPMDWALCEGQLLQINEYNTLFALIGTTYGGDGVTTFALPDLRGRLPIHKGAYFMGQWGGSENVVLTPDQLPRHWHSVMASKDVGVVGGCDLNVPAAGTATAQIYIEQEADLTMYPAAVQAAGGSQAHNNVQPFLCLNYIISLQGEWPAQE